MLFRSAEPTQLSTRERYEEMPVELSRVNLAWHIPAVTHPDVYPLDVLAIVLGQGKSSRLYRELRQKRGLVHSIEASSYTPAYPGLFNVEAMTDADKRDAAIAAIREHMGQLATEPISESEVQKAIKISTSNLLDRLKTMSGQASDIAHNEILVGDPNFSETYLENLRKVTRNDVQRVARQYLTDDNLTITTLDPAGTMKKVAAVQIAGEGINIQKIELPDRKSTRLNSSHER